MTKVYHVKKALKDNSVCKKGESYYWWSFRFGGKHYSLTYPKPSQLTNSEFLSQAYALNERIAELNPDNFNSIEDLQSEVEDIVEEFESLGEECYDKLNNMPEGLQESEVGCLLQERSDACSEVSSNLQSIDFDFDEEDFKDEYIEEQVEEVEVDEDEILEQVKALGWSVEDVPSKSNEELEDKIGQEVTDRVMNLRLEMAEKQWEEGHHSKEDFIQTKIDEKISEIIEEVQGSGYDGA